MEYFNLSQIILLVFVLITSGIILYKTLSSFDFECDDDKFIKNFCLWSIYMVLSFGVYFYLGNI